MNEEPRRLIDGETTNKRLSKPIVCDPLLRKCKATHERLQLSHGQKPEENISDARTLS